MKMMKAARMHEVGGPLIIEEIPVPEVRPTDVLVAVKAVNVVPNLGNILANWPTWCPHLPLPKLPAIFGLDPVGVVERVGSHVHGIKPGDRVYVNPSRSCGGCRECRNGEYINCRNYIFAGYFGFGPENSQMIFDDYPYGGFCEYMTAPLHALVKLPDSVTNEQAARFGYLGTAYSAMKKVQVGPGKTVLISGATGTLGLGAVLIALAMGATRILGVARNKELLERVRQLDPKRIEVFSLHDGNVTDWVMSRTETGVDIVVDCNGPGTPAETTMAALKSLRRGGKAANIGGMMEELPLNLKWLMDENLQLFGSVWFTGGEGQEMADMAAAGTLDLSVFEHITYPFERINEALEGLEKRNGGFTNVVVTVNP